MQSGDNQIFDEIKECRLCSSKDLQVVLDLGVQPPANSLRDKADELEQSAPLKLVRCGTCSTIQLSVTVDPSYLFSKYNWVTATSTTARKYSEVYCSEVLSRSKVDLPFVVEIASNDGTFLGQFKKRGCQILGVDPAKNISEIANSSGITTLSKFFDSTVAKEIRAKNGSADIVMARNVIPHVKEIHSIVEGMSLLMGDKSIAVVEFHYAGIIAKELHYDSIYHEHLFYFSIESLTNVFAKYGLAPFDAFLSPISGGSLAMFFSKGRRDFSASLAELIKEESGLGLNKMGVWSEFGLASKKHANELKKVVSDCSIKGKLIGYGASARSSTMLNYAGISSNEIDCIIDNNPLKQGLFTPGSNIPIVSYAEGMSRLSEKDLLLLAWNFEEEIVADLRSNGFKGSIIVPLPNSIRIL